MPEICRFLDIVIYMYFNDHPPPHFHVKCNEFRAQISIETLDVIDGGLPQKQLRIVRGWAQQHKDELIKNWISLQETGTFDKIKPL
jgi:hypothetical protein